MRVKRHRVVAQIVALVAIFGVVRASRGAPGDVFSPGTGFGVTGNMLDASPPKGGAVADGDASVSTQTGALQYSYPIVLPPGRLGNQPTLALTYSSQAPIYGGVAAGWSLSIPEIALDTSEGTLDVAAGDVERTYLSTMAGSRPLIPTQERTTGPGVESTYRAQNDGSYARYERMKASEPHRWQAYSTDGTKYIFGDASLVTGTIDDDHVPLTRTIDPFGNTVEYQWTRDPRGANYLAEIRYTSNPTLGLPPFAKVTFQWNDVATCAGLAPGGDVSYRTGDREELGVKTLASITAIAFDPATEQTQHTRQITLSYDPKTLVCTHGFAPYRQLQSIQESAWGAGSPANPPRVDLPAATFTYGSALRADKWEDVEYGGWDLNAFAWGYRWPASGHTWPTVESMMIDINGDGLPDRLTASYNSAIEVCTAEWSRNTGQGFVPGGVIVLPHLPWAVRNETDGCSLNYQVTEVANMSGSVTAPVGSYLAYRWMDVTGDGLPELVTAIQADPHWYDPNADEPFGAWPSCAGTGPACVVLDQDCIEEEERLCDDDTACFLTGAATACVAPAPVEACYQTMTMECNGPENDPISCESGTIDPPGGPPIRLPHERCGRYPWQIYDNLGDGQIAETPRIILSPIPLESDNGDSPSGGGAFTSSWHAVIDLDGDGFLDAAMLATHLLSFDPGNDHRTAWLVWKGDGTGDFHGDGEGRPYVWRVPADSAPSHTDVENLDLQSRHQTTVSSGGLADFNGDGLPDLYRRVDETGPIRVYFNNGCGFSNTPTQLPLAVTTTSATYIDPTERNGNLLLAGTARSYTAAQDYDADGRVDVRYTAQDPETHAWSTTPQIWFNDGAGLLSTGYPTNAAENAALDKVTHATATSGLEYIWQAPNDVVDLDGDGLSEHAYLQGEHIRIKRTRVDGTPLRLLTRVDNGQGLHVDVRYAPLSDNSVVTTHVESGKASPHTTWVVKSITTSDDFESSASTSTYRYIDPVWSPDDRGKWGFRGFETVKSTNPRGAVTEQRYDYSVDWSGRLATSLTYLSSQATSLVTIGDTTWSERTLFGGIIETFQPTVTRTYTCRAGQDEATCRTAPSAFARDESVWTLRATDQDTDPTPLLWTESRTYHQDSEAFDEGDRYTDTGSHLFSDDRTYRLRATTSTSFHRIGGTDKHFARSETLWDPSYRFALTSRVYSDPLNATVYGDTVQTYDPTGNVLTTTKPNQVANGGTSTTYVYDSRKLFVDTTTQYATLGAPAQVTRELHEYGTGAVVRTLGPNVCTTCGPNLTTEEQRTDIDGLGRPIATWVSRDASPGYQLVNVSQITYVDAIVAGLSTSITTRHLIEYGNTRWTQEKTQLDGHGRAIKTTTIFGSQTAATSYDYDVDGKVIAITMPDPSMNGEVTYSYNFDSIGRPTRMRRPDGTSPTTSSGLDLFYDGTSVTRIEFTGNAGGPAANTQLISDAFGRLVYVIERSDAGGSPTFATTTYAYDPHDIVKTIIAPGNTVGQTVATSMTHDLAGRRTRIVRGSRTWEYGYDRNGNLTSETTPIPGNNPALKPSYTTAYAFDDLDRVISKSVAPRGLSTADRQLFGIGDVLYAYDTTADGKNRVGRLYQAIVRYAGGPDTLTTTYDYDAEGNTIEDRRVHRVGNASGAGSITGQRRIKSTFWPGGRIREVDNGDGVATDDSATKTRTDYDDRGLASRLLYQRPGGPWLPAADLTRNAAGMVTTRARAAQSLFEVAQSSTWTYDKLGRIKRQQVVAGTTSIADQQFTYWGADDPKTLMHSGSGLSTRNFNFTYDLRHQLLTAATTQTGAPSFNGRYAFNPGGRFGNLSVSAGASPGSDVRNRLPSVTYAYSPTDPEMVTALRTPAGGTFASYVYDDAGNTSTRVQEGVTTTLTWDGDDHLRRVLNVSTGALEDYYYDHDGNRFATVKRSNAATVTQAKYVQGPVEIWQSAANAVTATYATASLGTPIARFENRADPELQYTSSLQSLLAATTLRGVVNVGFAYGPYGEVLQETGAQATTHRYRYNNKHKDDLTGYLYYGYRYLDTVSQRWISADPAYRFTPETAWGDPRRAALYLFTLGNPLRYVDPDGRNGDQEAAQIAIGAFVPFVCGCDSVKLYADIYNTVNTGPVPALAAVASITPVGRAVTSPLALGGWLLPDVIAQDGPSNMEGRGAPGAPGGATPGGTGGSRPPKLKYEKPAVTSSRTMSKREAAQMRATFADEAKKTAAAAETRADGTFSGRGSEHTKGSRASTKGTHEAGETRRARDKGGEKGDKRRPRGGPGRSKM